MPAPSATEPSPVAVRLTEYVPHAPHAPQQAFLWLNCLEAFYGGAAGGGKSDALLMAALQYVDVPGYAALLLRRTYTDLSLPGAIMDRAQQWLRPTDARWNDVEKTWRFPGGGTLTFGYLQTERDKYRYQSAEFQFVGFDELTQFPEADYRYLFSRLRRLEDVGVPLRMRSASNPGGRGARWVKRRLIEKRVDPNDPEDTPERAAARIFIPAKLKDNPSVDRESYLGSLTQLDPQTRAQLLNGDWNAREHGDWVLPVGLDQVFDLGARLDADRRARQIPPPVGDANVLCADWGVHAHVVLLWPLEGGGFYAVREVVNDVASIRTVAPRVARVARAAGWPVRWERYDASMPGLNETFLEQLRELLPAGLKSMGVSFSKYKALTVDYLRLLAGNSHLRVLFPKGAGITDLSEVELRAVAQRVGEEHDPDDVVAADIVAALTTRAKVGPILAISEAGCPVLAEQARQWEYDDPETGTFDKEDDHGPDAVIAGVAPVAAKRRK